MNKSKEKKSVEINFMDKLCADNLAEKKTRKKQLATEREKYKLLYAQAKKIDKVLRYIKKRLPEIHEKIFIRELPKEKIAIIVEQAQTYAKECWFRTRIFFGIIHFITISSCIIGATLMWLSPEKYFSNSETLASQLLGIGLLVFIVAVGADVLSRIDDEFDAIHIGNIVTKIRGGKYKNFLRSIEEIEKK